MAVKSSGSLKFSEIASEFGATPPYKMSQFYKGAKVPDISNNTTVPSNGVIRFNNFYNTLNVFLFLQTISTVRLFYNIKSEAINAGWNQVSPLHAKITVTSFVFSNSTGSYAFSTGSGFPSNTRLELYNNHIISGCGGAFGAAQNNGGNGGPGILAEHQLYIRNNGTIGGGGGGGGGGAPSIYLTPSITAAGGRGGVGGGNGFTNGEVGLAGATVSGTLTGVTYTATGGRGGSGGNIGSSGGSGSLGSGNRAGFISVNNRPGGAAGNGIVGTYSFF